MCQDFITLIDEKSESHEPTNISKIKYLEVDKENVNAIEKILIEEFNANRIY